MRNRNRRAAALPCLALLCLMALGLPGPPALAAPRLLEDLHYRMSVLVWPDAARIRVTLKRLGPNRFAAEVLGETQGFIKVISGNHRERLATEMVWRDHRLLPLVYREESWRNDKHRLKEYRFDYTRGRLVLWEWHKGKGVMKKWQTRLTGPIYDPLTAFYNCRLGLLGPPHEGGAATIPGIPYPRPEPMEIRLGPKTKNGQRAMVSLDNPVFQGSRDQVFADLDDRLVPRRTWTTVYGVTINGVLLPQSIIMPAKLSELTGPGPVAARQLPVDRLPPGPAGGNQR